VRPVCNVSEALDLIAGVVECVADEKILQLASYAVQHIARSGT
jgi:hypothetical protein